jgi:ABC-type antimicrobial peptide transport system permease subunit
VNVTNLMLVRSDARKRAILVRRALGASAGRILAQIQVEILVLTLAGAAVGCILASLGVEALVAFVPSDMLPRYVEPRVDLRALSFAVVVAVAVGGAIGLVPAVRSQRVNTATGLREGSAATGGRGHGSLLQPALVVVELAVN